MTTESIHIECSAGSFHLLKAGSGPIPLLGIHGYGASGSSLLAFQEHLQDMCTAYLIDLPFHGDTRWAAKHFKPEDLIECFEQLMEEYQLPPAIFLGESLGARIWMHLLPELSDQCRALWLVSPEGFQGKWTHLVSRLPKSWEGRLAKLTNRPERLMAWAHRMRRLGFLDKPSFIFLQRQLSPTHRRERLLATWRSLRYFPPNWEAARRQIRKAAQPVRILLGTQDEVIRNEKVEAFFNHFRNVEIDYAAAGHYIRGAELAAVMQVWKEKIPR